MADPTTQVGRSREELLAAAAALTAAANDMDERGAAVVLTERAVQFEEEAMDAPPISAAGEVTDDMLLNLIGFVWGSAGTSALMNVGVPAPTAEAMARRVGGIALADPLIREELITATRHVLAGRCSCGGPMPTDGHQHERRRWQR